jgi:hypothetical protein
VPLHLGVVFDQLRVAGSTQHGARSRQPTMLFYSPDGFSIQPIQLFSDSQLSAPAFIT